MSESIGVLFVCTGNICRSPTAEAVFRHKLRAAGLDHRFFTDSAGTHGYHIGDPPDPRSIDTALAHGVNMRDLRARRFEVIDFERFHHVVAMDAGHFDALDRLPREEGAIAALSLFRHFGAPLPIGENPAILGVPDPYYGTSNDFERVYMMIESGCEKILNHLVTNFGGNFISKKH